MEKIAIMLTLILAAGTFVACRAEKKVNANIRHPQSGRLRMFLYLRKLLKWQQQKKQLKAQPPTKEQMVDVQSVVSAYIEYGKQYCFKSRNLRNEVQRWERYFEVDCCL